MGKCRYFHAVWPLIYTKTQFLSEKTIISKTSGQSGEVGKLWLCVVVSTGRNRVLGSHAHSMRQKMLHVMSAPYVYSLFGYHGC